MESFRFRINIESERSSIGSLNPHSVFSMPYGNRHQTDTKEPIRLMAGARVEARPEIEAKIKV
jgi:hypothetical protein